MKKIFSSIAGAALAVTLLFSVTGCGDPTAVMSTANADDSQNTITALENAQVITLKKSIVTIGGDSWSVRVDDKEVATIKGQAFKLIGDTYSMYSTSGNFVGAEAENLQLVTHSAQMYDFNGNKTGVIAQQFSYPFTNFDFTDAQNLKVGSMSQNLSMTLAGTAKDSHGSDAWKFSKEFFSLGATLKMERQKKTDLSAMTAIWTAVIMNEISEGSSSDSSNSGSSKSK